MANHPAKEPKHSIPFRDASRPVEPAKVSPGDGTDVDVGLENAWKELRRVREEAQEDDLPEPDEAAIRNAGVLLPELYATLRGAYHIYPTERGGVGISAPGRRGAAVVVECAPLDRVYCFVTLDGQSRRAKYYQMDGLPDEFIKSALRTLGH